MIFILKILFENIENLGNTILNAILIKEYKLEL